MNSANVEEVVKQVLESMLKTPVSAAPAAASKSQAIPETAHVAMLTALEHYDIKEFPLPEVGEFQGLHITQPLDVLNKAFLFL